MIEGIERINQQIAESIQEAIPEEWDTAKMEVIFFPGSSTYLGEYTRKADGKARGFATTRSGERAFRELRKKFREAGKPVWGKACFQIQSSGKFNLQFGYEDCDENGNVLFNEEEELRKAEERHKRLTSE